MDNNTIPYIVYEIAEAKNERTIKRLIIALVITVILMFATNVFWIYEFCSYDYEYETTSTTVEADSGTANYIGQDGDITYGTNNGDKENEEKT